MSGYHGIVCLPDSKRTRGDSLSHFAPAYPGSSAGFALLLLRVALAFTAIYKGWDDFLRSGRAVGGFEVMGVLLLLIGMALFAGLGTRLASVLLFVVLAGEVFWSRPGAPSLDQLLPILLSESMSVGLALLGPGAFSIDARRFGRREIVIAPSQDKL
jgi:putative oxidoreductase